MPHEASATIEPSSAALGARVTGIDLSQPLDSDQFETLHQAILDHQVLVLPDQNMSEDDHVRFTEMWGSMPVRDRYKNRNEKRLGNEKIMLVTNVRENGKPIGSLPDGEVMFHSDGAYDEHPYKYTLLFSIDIPSAGGNTLFANMYLAYETLPEDLKTKLATYHGRNLYYSGTMRKDEQVGEYSGCTDHPLFVKHDETGRTSIYISRLITDSIPELEAAESESLLAELLEHCEREELIYEHRWSEGDFVMWDNRCVTHARRDFPENERRLLRRTTIQGTRPLPANPLTTVSVKQDF
jgi:taurine dioxygenase